jgi:chromosome segregation protein
MRIKTLEMSGFKSFADRTVVHFEEGVTGVVGPNGCGKCVHGDTLVPTADGAVVSIRTLVEDAFARAESVEHMDDGQYTYDNPCGVEVLSLDRKTLKMEKRPVLAFVRRSSPDTLLKVTTRSGRTITATEYHPFFIQENAGVRSIRADELQPGLWVAMPRCLPVKPVRTHFAAIAAPSQDGGSELCAVDNMLVTKSVRTKPLAVATALTPEWGRFLGYVISEGQNSAHSDHVRFVNSDAAVLEDFSRCSEALFGCRPVRKSYKVGSEDCLLNSSILCDMLERSFGVKRGGHSRTKRVPALMFEAKDEVVWAFLTTLIEGDGCIRIDRSDEAGKPTAHLEYATASQALARGVATLLLRMGVRSMIRRKMKRATNSTGPAREYFSVYVYGTENLRRLNEGLSLVSEKRERLAEACRLAEPAATLDAIPDIAPSFGTLWESSGSAVTKTHALRGRLEAYRSGRCKASRSGLAEAVAYVREHAASWNDEMDAQASRLETLASSDIYWDEIASVEKTEGEEWVYDLCVERDHNFVANDFIVHNSNIVDAIRWVMGEMSAKHLRGAAMEDVIFNGCESRPPVGMSQVFLTFDNSDGRAPAEYAQYSEIQVGRRLYRSGESEYFINKTVCRLKDIVDLFLGTGVGTKAYSIVEQGMVGSIVSSKPDDRRMLIEEAAGISKFKSRKEAALRKMDSTRQNLARLTDVLNELSRQINSLNRQAKKAERYQRISEELRGRELALAATKYRGMRAAIEEMSHENELLREQESAASAELAGFEAESETARLALAEVERELDGVQQQLYRVEHAIKFCESEIGHRSKERAKLGESSEEDKRELATLTSRAQEIDGRIDKANDELVRADLRLAGSADVVAELEDEVSLLRRSFEVLRSECDVMQKKVMSEGETVANLAAALDHLERRRVDITGRMARDQAEIDAIDRRREQLAGSVDHRARELDGARQLRFQITQESESAVATLDQQRAALSDAESVLQTLRDETSEKRSELNTIRELRKNLEGYRDGVRAVLARTDAEGEKLAGIKGTVSEIVETRPEYETALSAVLGERLQYVVVRSHEEGAEAIDYLKQAAQGRSSFIPLDVRYARVEGAEPEGEGVIGRLSNFVTMSEEYWNVCDYLLSDIVLVESLGKALDLWRSGDYRKTFVTLDGSVVDASGVVTGGSSAGVEEQLVVQKRRAKELESEVGHLAGELTRAEGEAMKLRDRVKSIEEHVESLKRDSHGEELKFIGQERDLERDRDELKRLEEERDRLTVETAAMSEEVRKLELEREESFARREACRVAREEAETKLADLALSLETVTVELGGGDRKLTDLKVELAQAEERQSSATRELENLVRQKAEVVVAIGRRGGDLIIAEQRSETLMREIEHLRQEVDLSIRAVARLKETQRLKQQRFDEEQARLRERELEIRDVRRRHDEALQKVHGLELTLTEKRGAEHYLVEGIRERYHLELAQVTAEYARDDLNVEEEDAAVGELKEALDKIGSVNVDAIKEFDELTVRHEFIARQHGDLENSLENLSKAIHKINRTSRQRFRRAFDAVNEQFTMLFPKLFRGGRASLVLTDEENLLETGVEIVAQPPGKKLQSITLLSGGEKALTAVALVFSIFLIKPSPFCLLDEVDAPLDDANIDRFNDLIRSMTPHSQFILITHNKRTMELADLLYGITMEEAGVSKLVSVRLGGKEEDEAPKEDQGEAVA